MTYLLSFPEFQLLDIMFLTCRRPFVVTNVGNCTPASTAILALICKTEFKEKFTFRPSKHCTNNHKTVTLVSSKRFMKLEKVIFVVSIPLPQY